MTVGELIKELSKYDSDCEIHVYEKDDIDYIAVGKVLNYMKTNKDNCVIGWEPKFTVQGNVCLDYTYYPIVWE